MILKCQEDSYLQEFTTVVKSCEKKSIKTLNSGKKVNIDGYGIVLENTIIFPEGGGQPSDYGWLNNVEVLQVNRNPQGPIHFVKDPIEVGTTVQQKVDWNRRFDHMQQHSGQHLLSAILEKEHDLATASWWLGEEESHVELNCDSLTPELIKTVEDRCNSLIRSAAPVVVKVVESDDPQLEKAHTRGLPDDHTGPIRIISIKDIDDNMCCGTHVKNLSELQAIKLLKAEPGNRKHTTNLKFVVGSRVLSTLQKCYAREQGLTVLLKNDSSKHVELVDKLQKSVKVMNKNLRNTLTDVANLEATAIKSLDPIPAYVNLHRKEGDMDYVKATTRAFNGVKTFLFVAIGEGKQGGNVYFQGEEKDIKEIAPKICEILKGKGAGKGNTYQAKVQDLTPISKCFELIKAHFAATNGSV